MEKNYKSHSLSMKALSDETRLKIFEMLSHNELCACEILEEFNITQPTLSYHMKSLSESGLIESRKDGIKTLYSINKNNLERLREFIDSISENLNKKL